MKLSEYIKKLETILQTQGDMRVLIMATPDSDIAYEDFDDNDLVVHTVPEDIQAFRQMNDVYVEGIQVDEKILLLG